MGAPALKRSIGLGLLTLYGLGAILGAGIYVLVGEVARVAGTATPTAVPVTGLLLCGGMLLYQAGRLLRGLAG